MADQTEPEIQLPVASFRSEGFQPMDLVAFGADLAQHLIGRPLASATIFRDSVTPLPALSLIFGGPAMLSDQGLLLSPRPTSTHPFAQLDTLLVSGASLGLLQYAQPEPPADQPSPEADHQWAGRTVAAGQLRAIALHLAVVAWALADGAPLSQGRRQELSALLKPVLATFQGAITAELCRQEQQPSAGGAA